MTLDSPPMRAYIPRVMPPTTPKPAAATQTPPTGKHRRKPARGAEHARRVQFGIQWGAFAKQVSADLRRERG